MYVSMYKYTYRYSVEDSYVVHRQESPTVYGPDSECAWTRTLDELKICYHGERMGKVLVIMVATDTQVYITSLIVTYSRLVCIPYISVSVKTFWQTY